MARKASQKKQKGKSTVPPSGGTASSPDLQTGSPLGDGAAFGGAPIGGATGAAPPAAGPDKVAVLGHAVWLMTQSAGHKHLFLTDLDWLVMPALLLGQFRIWHQKDKQGNNIPVAFVSWAFLDDDGEARIKLGIKKLAPTDWKAGDNLWLMDVVAPFGGGEKAVEELRETVFKGRTMKSIQPAPDGSGIAVVEW